MTSEEVLLKILKLNNFPIERLTSENIIFLKRYTIEREISKGRKSPSANDILKSKDLKEMNAKKNTYYGETDYYNNYPYVRYAKDILNNYFGKYNNEKRRDGFKSFRDFLAWWCKQKNECYYCKIDAATSGFAFKSRIFKPKKEAWKNGVLQIEKKDPNGIYEPDNCVLACPLCNNAKSDMITYPEFKKHFAESFENYWQDIKKDKIEQMQQQIVYFSSLLRVNNVGMTKSDKKKQLAKKYKLPQSADSLFKILDEYNIPHNFIENTNDIWVRDFMPVKTKSGIYVSFKYDPCYLDKYQHLKTDYRKNKINNKFPLPIIYSKISLDGGNVVFSPHKDKVIISDRVYKENSEKTEDWLVAELEQILEATVIIINLLPCKKDMTGHADGMVRFVDKGTIVCNDLDQNVIKNAFEKAGVDIDIKTLPYMEPPKNKGYSAVGCYINYLETEKYIFLPVFAYGENDKEVNDMDQKAEKEAKKIFKNKKIVTVNIREIAEHGGGLNCISWEM